MTKYIVKDKSGEVWGDFETRKEAQAQIAWCENCDKYEGDYEDGRYEIEEKEMTDYQLWKADQLRSQVFNALADIAADLEPTEEEMELAYEWFAIRFFEDEIGR